MDRCNKCGSYCVDREATEVPGEIAWICQDCMYCEVEDEVSEAVKKAAFAIRPPSS